MIAISIYIAGFGLKIKWKYQFNLLLFYRLRGERPNFANLAYERSMMPLIKLLIFKLYYLSIISIFLSML